MRSPSTEIRAPRWPRLAAALLLWLGIAAHPGAWAAPGETGHPIMRGFPPGAFGLGHLCQAVAQDAGGFIYTANFSHASFYDGTAWKLIKLPTESAGIRKFARTAEGVIFAGGAGVIGYFRAVGLGREFVSLAAQLPPSEKGCDEISDVLAVGHDVYFADEEKIIIWRGGRFTLVPCRTPPRSRGTRLHRAGDAVYVTAPGRALCRLVNDRLDVIADDPVFRENAIITVERTPEGALTFLTAGRGFFQLTDDRVAPLPAGENRWLAGKTIFRALRLRDGSLVVAFTAPSGDGGMRFNAAGDYAGPIDESIGLSVKTLRDFFQDHEDGLWIGTETGLLRLEWPSAISVFSALNGLGLGATVDLVRHQGVLYAATNEGVYRLIPSDDTGRMARFERMATMPTYGLLSHPAGLLVAGYTNLFVHTAAGLKSVAKLAPGGGTLHASQRTPHRVWIKAADGPRSLLPAATGWTEEKPAPGQSREAWEQEFSSDKVSTDPAAGKWVVQPQGMSRTRSDGGAPQRFPILAPIYAGAATKLWEEPDANGGALWICGADHLIRVELGLPFPSPPPFVTLLSTSDVKEGARLPSEHTALTFAFVALRHTIPNGVSYQTRLVGHDADWSTWSKKRERVFTGLPAGKYRFEVRARDADGRLATPAAFRFTVLAPWWRTWWALAGYAAAGTGVLGGVVRWRTSALRQRTARLEGIVAQRTAELAQRNIELLRLHQLELDEKIAARLAEEKARLEVLRYQLNPHFLFNTLASISSALPSAQSTARTMVERLANFCRLTLHRTDDREWTSLGEELQILRVYLEIEQSRWGDLLDVVIACDPALEGERLPHFLLLPLVENALKYGRATSPERVGLRLAARREASSGTAARSKAPDSPSTDGTESRSATGHVLILEVSNTGTWIEPAEKKTVSSLGIGLDNLRERLARYYPRSHELTVASADGWVTATLRIWPA